MYRLGNNILTLNNKPFYGYGVPILTKTTLFKMTFENTLVPVINNTIGNIAFSSYSVISLGFSTLCCEGTYSYRGRAWYNGDYWQWLVNTTGFQNLTFSFYSMFGATYATDYNVRVSPNGTDWTIVIPTFTYPSPNTCYFKTSDVFPASCNNNATTYIRIVKVGDITSSFYHYIDDVELIGYK